MEAKTSGAWLVHHSIKLQQITGSQEFNTVSAAGKAGTLLSALSSNDQTSLSRAEVEALAKAANINVLWELNPILDRLRQRIFGDEPSDSWISVYMAVIAWKQGDRTIGTSGAQRS
jgi:hypothetical protein